MLQNKLNIKDLFQLLHYHRSKEHKKENKENNFDKN